MTIPVDSANRMSFTSGVDSELIMMQSPDRTAIAVFGWDEDLSPYYSLAAIAAKSWVISIWRQ